MAPVSLQEVLKPMPQDEFIQQFWGKKYCHIKGTPGRFASLLSWNDLNRVLRQNRLDYPRLRIALEGDSSQKKVDSFIRHVPTRRGISVPRLDPVALAALLRQGATLIIDAIDEMVASIETLAVDFERVFSEYVQVNTYAAWTDKTGFKAHWDDHDVLILQIIGRKYWKIHGVTREAPLYRDDENVQLIDEPPKGAPFWEGMLEDGDLLYLPRGVWHSAHPINEPTLHLTFGITKRTGLDFLAWILDKLRGALIYRHDLPRFLKPPDLAAHQEHLLQQLLTTWQTVSLADYFADSDAMSMPRAHANLPYSVRREQLKDVTKVQIASPRNCPAFSFSQDGNTFEFRTCGKTWRFGRDAESVMVALFRGVPLTIGELASSPNCSVDRDSVYDLVRELLVEGLLVLVEQEPQ